MSDFDVQRLRDAMNAAASGFGDYRAMRVTLECGHLRLMTAIGTIMGIGAETGCLICPKQDDGYTPSRVVVNVEETGVLHEEWGRRVSEGLPVERVTA